MPKLSDVKGVAEKAKKKSAKVVPTMEGRKGAENRIARYNAAADRVKAAQAEMAKLAPELISDGLEFVFKHNCESRTDTKKQIKSVNMVEAQDDTTEEVLQFTWSSRVGKLDPDAVTAFFKNLVGIDGKSVDVNAYAEWAIVADFDKKVFVDEKGKFQQKRFDRFKAAIQTAADELGVDNPLTFAKEFKATKEANDLRFQQLDLAQNLELHLVIPTTTSLEPVRSKEEEE